MDEDDRECNINFIPCVKFLRRGVAKPVPERVKLNADELAAIINETKGKLNELEEAEDDDSETEEQVDEDDAPKAEEEEPPATGDRNIEKEYDMDNYDEEESSNTFGIGDLVVHSNPRDDPFLVDPDQDEELSDTEDFEIRPTDNLIAVGHVEGDASILEVYVYNDVEDALYVHHDMILPSFPMTLEWLSYDPGEETKGNMIAVGTMDPIIEVWDLDLVDNLEPAYRLGQKGSKKKKTKTVGHKDAVLSLAWNHHVEYVLASGSVDQKVLLWDLSEGSVKSTLKSHREKIQALQWHPKEAHCLATGCCDQYARVYDCRTDDNHKAWKVDGEVEKVLWNHFDPFTFLVATESGMVECIDVRNDKKSLWKLKAHSEGINGLSLSSQCPGCLVTVSTDHTLKIWDIADNKPECIQEKDLKLGLLHAVDYCPDAPFVFCVGGDKPADNLKVFDIRTESAAVRHRFGTRKMQNPLGFADFGYATANDFETELVKEEMDVAPEVEMEAMSLEGAGDGAKPSGGAAAKFRKKDKKKKKKKQF